MAIFKGLINSSVETGGVFRSHGLETQFGQKIQYVQVLLRGGIVNRTYDRYKNLYISLFLQAIFGPIYNGFPYY